MDEPWALIICTTTSLNAQIGPFADMEKYVHTDNWRFYASWPNYETFSRLTEEAKQDLIEKARNQEIQRRKRVFTSNY
jgi:hypothetical protein